ncbi:XRN 5'-3' exonuclease N-terminus-domain-containing protein [Tuber indicum]|nr:XRN 5'-3' exonuclease N-terminus-domain-containing protein [Tuber indicum]
MGVPALFRWLTNKYPKIVSPVIEEQPQEIDGVVRAVDTTQPNPNGESDNLYLDMNGIVHPCSHPEEGEPPATEEAMMLAVFAYTERVVNMVRPNKLLMIAVDGVAPRAKMNQQRSRRFRSAQEAKEKEDETAQLIEQMEKHGSKFDDVIKNKKIWDSNAITPGTPFMDILAASLKYWIAKKLNDDPAWAKLKIIISDSTVPGEGEHKIMEFIRSQRLSPEYDPNTRHVIYGLDADLIMLGLGTHEPHFKVLREDVFAKEARAKTCRIYNASPLKPFFELERALDDWIFMCFFVGNDFLPHLPSLEIRENGIDTLIAVWKDNIPLMGGYVTKDGTVDLKRVQYILDGLAKQEDQIFRNRKRTISTTAPAISHKRKADMVWGDETPKTPGSESEADDPDRDPVRLWEPGYRERYYEQKFHVSPDNVEFRNKVAASYVEGLCWVLLYYFQGCPSWTWYYPYHYAPFAQDFNDVGKLDIQFKKGKPFRPFEQLMGVLPAASKHALPEPFQKLMTEEDSEIIDFYPESFPIDLNGKKFAWQGVALLPFIDEKRLLDAVSKIYPTLTPEDNARNAMGHDLLFCSVENDMYDDVAIRFYYKGRSDDEYDLDPAKSQGLSGKVIKDPAFIPQGTIPFPLSLEDMPKIEGDKSLCVFYEFPKTKNAHKSMLLRGVKLSPSVLSHTDLEMIKNKAQNSGRSYGGAPLYRSNSGRGRGRGSGGEFQGSYQSNRGPTQSYPGQNHTPSYGNGTWQPPPPPPALTGWGGWGGQHNQVRGNYTNPQPPYIAPGQYQQGGRYPPPPPSAPPRFSHASNFGRGQPQGSYNGGGYNHNQSSRDDRYRPGGGGGGGGENRYNDHYNDRRDDRGRGGGGGGYRGGRGGGGTNRARGDNTELWRR